MTVQEKLILFAERTLERVNIQHREASREIQETIRVAVREAEAAACKDMEAQLKIEESRLEREAHKKIHAASMAARQKQVSLQDKLSDELFSDLEGDLRCFANGKGKGKHSAYSDFLLEGIAANLGQDFHIVQLMQRDMTYKTAIEAETDFVVEETEEDFIGGFKLLSSNRRAIADYTLLARLGELNEDRSNLWHKRPGADGS